VEIPIVSAEKQTVQVFLDILEANVQEQYIFKIYFAVHGEVSF
jgi:hypothetical protein